MEWHRWNVLEGYFVLSLDPSIENLFCFSKQSFSIWKDWKDFV